MGSQQSSLATANTPVWGAATGGGHQKQNDLEKQGKDDDELSVTTAATAASIGTMLDETVVVVEPKKVKMVVVMVAEPKKITITITTMNEEDGNNNCFLGILEWFRELITSRREVNATSFEGAKTPEEQQQVHDLLSQLFPRQTQAQEPRPSLGTESLPDDDSTSPPAAEGTLAAGQIAPPVLSEVHEPRPFLGTESFPNDGATSPPASEAGTLAAGQIEPPVLSEVHEPRPSLGAESLPTADVTSPPAAEGTLAAGYITPTAQLDLNQELVAPQGRSTGQENQLSPTAESLAIPPLSSHTSLETESDDQVTLAPEASE